MRHEESELPAWLTQVRQPGLESVSRVRKTKTGPFCVYVIRIVFTLRVLLSATFLRHLEKMRQPSTSEGFIGF